MAILQHKAKEREAKQEAKLKGIRANSVQTVAIFNKKNDFEFENKEAAN